MQIEVKNVSKQYGETKALSKVSFSLSNSGVVGLVGRNGAGKTTLIKVIMDIIKPDEGSVTFKDVDGKLSIGYLPEERGLYLNISVLDQLMLIAELNGITKKEALDNIKLYLEKLEIPQYLNVVPKKLSKGNKQKIQLVSAIVHKPKIVILDEPFSGLDPVNIDLFKSVITEYIDDKRMLIFSSHQLFDVEQMCNYVIFVNEGNVPLQGHVNEIKSLYECENYFLRTNNNVDHILDSFRFSYEKSDQQHTYTIYNLQQEQVNNFLYSVIQSEHCIIEFKKCELSLHDIFVKEFA